MGAIKIGVGFFREFSTPMMDAPAPGNVTIVPDAVGDNPATIYMSMIYTGEDDTRSLESIEYTYEVGDSTTEIIFNCDPIPAWASGILIGASEGTGIRNAEISLFTIPADILTGWAPANWETVLSSPIHQVPA